MFEITPQIMFYLIIGVCDISDSACPQTVTFIIHMLAFFNPNCYIISFKSQISMEVGCLM